VRSYNNLDRDTRSNKLRKVVREFGSNATTFAEALWSESLIESQAARIASLDTGVSSGSGAATSASTNNNNSSWRDGSGWRLNSADVVAATTDADFADAFN
jgi:hypothetical protein